VYALIAVSLTLLTVTGVHGLAASLANDLSIVRPLKFVN
jgi:hypothetical protein